MIEYLRGEIAELTPTRLVMDCSGIGYEIHISLHTYSTLNGQPSTKIFIQEIIREDAHLLFGFSSKNERELFLLLTSVSGVGPNTARMILSSLSPDELVQVIASANESALTAVKGIGLKTAQRIIVDLKNKVKIADNAVDNITGSTISNSSILEEAVAALIMLGFPKAASQKVVSSIMKSSPALTVEQVIKDALRIL